MCTLAHVFEAAGLATVVLSTIRPVAEKMAPPRALHCEFPLGRPLGNHGPVRRLPLADVVYDGAWNHPADWAVDPVGTRFAGPPPA